MIGEFLDDFVDRFLDPPLPLFIEHAAAEIHLRHHDAFCKLHDLTRSSVLVRGALALCGIPLKGCGGDAAATGSSYGMQRASGTGEPTLADECGGAGS
jgi:hypothetical protein